MPPRSTVDRLDDREFEWLVKNILAGCTDRELEAGFKSTFGGKCLSKSSIARWRASAGEQLAEKFRLARYVARQLKEDLGESPDADSMRLAIENLEDHLLTASREVFLADPIKALGLRMEDKKLGLKQREIDLRERELELKREAQERDASLKGDRFQVASDFWKSTLAYLLGVDPFAADLLTKHSPGILAAYGEQVEAEA
jgi:hypothetical protein